MSGSETRQKRKGPASIGELVTRAIGPVAARRGIAVADLVAAWTEIAGPLHAAGTVPEKIVWPRHAGDGESAEGTLYLRVEGPCAIFVQHDVPQIIERANAFFGYRAIGQVRIVQGPVISDGVQKRQTGEARLDAADKAALDEQVGSVEGEELRAALARLGHGVFGARRE